MSKIEDYVTCPHCDRDVQARRLPNAGELRGECDRHGPIYENIQ